MSDGPPNTPLPTLLGITFENAGVKNKHEIPVFPILRFNYRVEDQKIIEDSNGDCMICVLVAILPGWKRRWIAIPSSLSTKKTYIKRNQQDTLYRRRAISWSGSNVTRNPTQAEYDRKCYMDRDSDCINGDVFREIRNYIAEVTNRYEKRGKVKKCVRVV